MLHTQDVEAQPDDRYITTGSYLFGLIKTKPKCAHNGTVDPDKNSIVCKGFYCDREVKFAGANYKKCG